MICGVSSEISGKDDFFRGASFFQCGKSISTCKNGVARTWQSDVMQGGRSALGKNYRFVLPRQWAVEVAMFYKYTSTVL